MDQPTFRFGWRQVSLLALLVVAGGAGGLYLADGLSRRPVPRDTSDPDANQAGGMHRFALSAFDAKDTAEAPDLAVGPDGTVMLAWGSKTGADERTVFLVRSADGGDTFDDPKVMSTTGIYRTPAKGGSSRGYERRAMPHLAAAGKNVYLSWGESLPDRSAMRMVLASSTDAGRTFGQARPVHSGKEANPSFPALAADPSGALGCAWLDDRSGFQQAVAVRRVGAGAFEDEQIVHRGRDGQGVCPCCPTGACFGPDGTLYVAFRNIDEGYRDIAVGRLRPGRPAEGPFPLVDHTWKFDGCPHDGPSLAVVGDSLHVAWMDARTGTPRCYHGRANLADMKFTTRELRPGSGTSQGNPKLLADSAGGLLAVWEESIGAEPAPAGHQHGPPKVGAGGGRAVMVAALQAGAAEFGPARAVAPKPGAFQTRPAIATGPAGVFVAWNELDDKGKAVVITPLAGPGSE